MNSNDSAGRHGQQREQLDLRAAEWAVRLAGGLSAAERRELNRWLAESPAHAAAFQEARTAWGKMGQLRLRPGKLAEDPVPPPNSPARRGPRRRCLTWKRGLASAACLLLLAVSATLWHGDPRLMLTADHHTQAGERRLVTLPDGSRVELGPASAIKLDYSASARRVVLLSGLAHFTAAPAANTESRPFVVAAANGQARVLGTEFMVAHVPGGAEVTVLEGRVEVARRAVEYGLARVLARGQAVRYSAAGLGSVRAVNARRATAWRRGRLIFDKAPLGEVVAALNRYRRGRIMITDPALASRRVSGIFQTTTPEAALATIARDLRINTLSLPLLTLLY